MWSNFVSKNFNIQQFYYYSDNVLKCTSTYELKFRTNSNNVSFCVLKTDMSMTTGQYIDHNIDY